MFPRWRVSFLAADGTPFGPPSLYHSEDARERAEAHAEAFNEGIRNPPRGVVLMSWFKAKAVAHPNGTSPVKNFDGNFS